MDPIALVTENVVEEILLESGDIDVLSTSS